MRAAQVLLAIQPKLLADALREILTRETDFEVVGQVTDSVELLTTVGKTNANVVIENLPDCQQIPGICSHLLTEYPDLSFIRVSSDGNGAYICRQTITTTRFAAESLSDLLTAIRSTLVLEA